MLVWAVCFAVLLADGTSPSGGIALFKSLDLSNETGSRHLAQWPPRRILLIRLGEEIGLAIFQIQDHLAEQSIRPGEPRPGPITDVPRIDTLVNQTQAVGAADQLAEFVSDLGVVAGREDPHDRGHGPGVAEGDVGTADGVENGAAHVVRVGGGQEKLARGLVEGIVDVVAEEGRRQQRRDVRVVHDVVAAVAVDFVRVDGISRHLIDAVTGDGGADGRRQVLHARREVWSERILQPLHDLGAQAQIVRKHHVCRDEELVGARVVRGPEVAADQACPSQHGVPAEEVRDRLCRRISRAIPRVGLVENSSLRVVGAHGQIEDGGHDRLDRLDPLEAIEEGQVGRGIVVVPRNLEERGEAVELVLAFENGGVGDVR